MGSESEKTSFPVSVKMKSGILGIIVDVMLWPNRATVDGIGYRNDELKGLISRGLSAADILAVHNVKESFEGQVM